MELPTTLTTGIRAHLARMFPDRRVLAIEPLAPDTGATKDASAKAAGYGQPVRVVLGGGDQPLELVWRTASANEFGHDRRADRAANQLLAFDDFNTIPNHVRALDVGVIHGHELVSIGDGELYLITTYAPGTIYADELRRVAAERVASDRDVAHVDALARYLAELHVPIADPRRYRRAIRDLVGHGEGIFGIVDGYPDDVPGAPRERLHGIERRCVEWRWLLHGNEHRLVRTHGDFHPFNLVFDGDRLAVLDASRGCAGDPADDVTALAVNYILFALDQPDAWPRGLGVLWQRLWQTYLATRPDPALTAVAPPFFAWRALVVCNPRFYPSLGARGRDALLALAEHALDTRHLDPGRASELFR